MTCVEGSSVTVTTLLAHASGQWISSDLTMTAQRQIKDGGGWEKLDTPQAIGSCITYARRYALAAMAGVAPEDDDAEGAQGRRSIRVAGGSASAGDARGGEVMAAAAMLVRKRCGRKRHAVPTNHAVYMRQWRMGRFARAIYLAELAWASRMAYQTGRSNG